MLSLAAGAAWAALVLYLLIRVLRQFHAHRATALSLATGAEPPAVSIIVPVRNEALNIAACLAGLTAQRHLDRRQPVIIVDDDSQDGTAQAVKQAIAAGAAVRLVTAGKLPAGWLGKAHACWQGAAAATGRWLCFIDADVRAAPQLVASAVVAAEAQRIDMLSLHPLQELGSFWERLVIPAGLLMIACVKRFATVAERSASEDLANGQFLLIRRDVYFATGGHAAVRGEVCEDRELAAQVKRAGFRFHVLSAERLARTRMYRDLDSLWEGLSKNITETFGGCRTTLLVAAAGLAIGWAALLLPAALAAASLRDPSPAAIAGIALALSGSSIVLAVQLGVARHFRIPLGFGLALVVGFTAAALLAWRSVRLQRDGQITWKGRTYDLQRKPAPGRS